MKIVAYTDGSSLGNPGPGGWGVLLETTLTNGKTYRKSFSGKGSESTTNNQMELMAVLNVFKALNIAGATVEIHTDSANVIGWLSQGWKRNKPEIELLCGLIDASISAANHTVTYIKEKGHSGDPGNERVDNLARQRAEEVKSSMKEV